MSAAIKPEMVRVIIRNQMTFMPSIYVLPPKLRKRAIRDRGWMVLHGYSIRILP